MVALLGMEGGSPGGAPTIPGLSVQTVMHFRPEELPASGSIDTWLDAKKRTQATQGTVAAQPTVTAAALDGFSAATFDGIDDYLVTGITDVPQPCEAWVVIKSDDAANDNYCFGSASAVGMRIQGNTVDRVINRMGGVNLISANGTAPNTNFGVVRVTGNGLVSETWFNGTLIAGPGDVGFAAFLNKEALGIGAQANGTSPKGCQIVELAVFPATLTDTDLTTIYTYFDGRYPSLGVTIP